MKLEDLGKRIRGRREKRGLKQGDIASALQVSPQAVSKWERGENAPDITLLGRLAALLGVTVDWLLGTMESGSDVFEATVLASSIEGAYRKSVGMNPGNFAAWANGIFLQITAIVLKHDGVPIKYGGDEFLCFFSGPQHPERAIQAVQDARKTISESETLRIGLSLGDIYFGEMGHPDYARPDIMGETVNLAFLTMNWAYENTKSGIAATAVFAGRVDSSLLSKKSIRINFNNIPRDVELFEFL